MSEKQHWSDVEDYYFFNMDELSCSDLEDDSLVVAEGYPYRDPSWTSGMEIIERQQAKENYAKLALTRVPYISPQVRYRCPVCKMKTGEPCRYVKGQPRRRDRYNKIELAGTHARRWLLGYDFGDYPGLGFATMWWQDRDGLLYYKRKYGKYLPEWINKIDRENVSCVKDIRAFFKRMAHRPILRANEMKKLETKLRDARLRVKRLEDPSRIEKALQEARDHVKQLEASLTALEKA